MYALYIIFIIANIIMIPLGIAMIRVASLALRAPRAAIMPVIVLLCAVGAFATGNNLFAVSTVAAFGVIGYVLERNGYPVAALVLGIVMGSMVEQSLVTSLIKSDESIVPFFSRPVAAVWQRAQSRPCCGCWWCGVAILRAADRGEATDGLPGAMALNSHGSWPRGEWPLRAIAIFEVSLPDHGKRRSCRKISKCP
jgi:Tripartite tricarboxylate transporter TctA family